MDTIPIDNLLIANGDYSPIKAFQGGKPIAIELTGTFDGATVALGFTSLDDTPVFIQDYTSAGVAITATSARRFFMTKPASGLPALRVTGAGASTEILVTISKVTE